MSDPATQVAVNVISGAASALLTLVCTGIYAFLIRPFRKGQRDGIKPDTLGYLVGDWFVYHLSGIHQPPYVVRGRMTLRTTLFKGLTAELVPLTGEGFERGTCTYRRSSIRVTDHHVFFHLEGDDPKEDWSIVVRIPATLTEDWPLVGVSSGIEFVGPPTAAAVILSKKPLTPERIKSELGDLQRIRLPKTELADDTHPKR